MKRIPSCIWIALAISAGGLRAEERPGEPGGPSGGRGESFPERLERGREREAGRPLPEPAERWLAELKERNPEMFRDLMRLREENPDRFRDEVHQAMRRGREEAFGPDAGERGGRPPRERAGEFPPGGPRGKLEPGSGPMPPHVQALETWLRGLKERNPERYEELMRLREENPERFRREVRAQLEKIREERRGWASEGREGPDRRDGENREAWEQAMRDKVQAWKAAGTEEERNRIRRELRVQIREGFERRMRMQEERLEELERQITELRENMARQRKAADRIVDERIRMMLHAERGPAPREPGPERPPERGPGEPGPTPR